MSEKDNRNLSETSSDESSYEGLSEQKKGKYTDRRIQCTRCSKTFKNMKTLKQHLRDHIKKHACNLCDKSFTRVHNLNLHKTNVHKIQGKSRETPRQKSTSFSCSACNKTFNRHYNLVRHQTRTHRVNTQPQSRALFSCRHCNSDFEKYEDLFNHVNKYHPLNQAGGRVGTTPSTLRDNEKDTTQPKESTFGQDNTNVTETKTKKKPVINISQQGTESSRQETALQNGVVNRYLEPEGQERYDTLVFMANVRDQVRTFLQLRARENGGIKWNLCLQVEMQRDDEQDSRVASPFFRSRTYITLIENDFSDHDLNEAMQKIFASLEKFIREGSGWYVRKVLKLEIHTILFKPLSGSTYLPLPESLSKTNSLLNIANQDDKCFLYCLLASLHPVSREPDNVEHYLPYQSEINMSDIPYPVALSHIGKVETQNENISINVFSFENDVIVPMKITEKWHRLHHIDLLLLTNESTSHYCLIKDLNRFLSRTNKHKSQLHFCSYCLHGFRKKTSMEEHRQWCSRHGALRVELPTKGKNDVLEFSDYAKTLKVPFVIYADFETINSKMDTCQPNPQGSSVTSMTKLEVCSFGYKVVCEDERHSKPSVIYRGDDAGKQLLECLLKEEEEIRQILSHIEPMQMSEEQCTRIEQDTHCCLCKKLFTIFDKIYGRIVRHHNHLTGEIIGLACNGCNLKCKQAKFVPVVFHNLKNFDAHILCENVGYFKNQRLRCIAQSTEQYVSFSLGGLRFIDSFQFLPASLETLVSDLAKDGLQAFPQLRYETGDDGKARLLLRKGVYPYEYMDSKDRFEESQLPSREEFKSTLKKEHISEEDYLHAQNVFEIFCMNSLGQYHDLYLKTDVLLLSDVFEAFRNLCMRQYELDPCHFYTSPGLSWSACLKMTGVRLELLSDIDKVLMVENGIRGGVSQISNRYKAANNPYIPNYNPSEPTTYLQYLDANNLYGWAMIQPLPIGEFILVEGREKEIFDVMSIPELGDTGYILDVSLEYPPHLHDAHNCLPLAPERQFISNDNLSPYALQLKQKLFGLSHKDTLQRTSKVEKLLTTLENKTRYILHYRNLQLYLSLGMKLKTIHRLLKFKQTAWMKPYIDQNTAMRQEASSTFQKNFYKLLNVSVFGKTMENVRRHKNIELVHERNRLRKLSAKPSYKNSIIFNENLVAVELYKNKVDLCKPIYCGMSILDLSKCHMYDFWYNYIKRKYGDTAQLQMTDTDSFLFSCQTEDIYQDMNQSIDYFDTSDFPKEHPLHNNRNKKVLGKFKDETNGNPILEFVGLRSKMYSYLCKQGDEQKRAKGVSKVTVSKDLKHEHYKNVLFEETSRMCSMTSLRSHKHQLYGETIRKKGLSAFDDKRYLVDSVNSYAYGHCNIKGDLNDNNVIDTNSEPTLRFTLESNVSLDKESAFTIDDFTITPCVKQCE